MSQQELVRRVIGVLQDAGIEYMITGSWASSMYGEPRATHDIDVVVSLSSADVPNLIRSFEPPDFYLSEVAVVVAIQNKSMFNLISVRDGEKVDFWLLTEDPFNQSSFARKRVEDFDGFPLQVSTPEDTILAKLRWAQLSGGSEKQFRDVLRVYEVQHVQLDVDYLNHWVNQLGVESLWERVQSEAKVP